MLIAVISFVSFGAGAAEAQATCNTDEDCRDGNICNGIERCDAGACLPGTPLDCDDGDVCTADSCSPRSGCVNECNPYLDASCFVSIGDYVWDDRGADGVQEPARGIEDVRLELLSCYAGSPNSSLGTSTTDADGFYEFVVPTCSDESLAIRVTGDNFASGGALVGFESSPQDAIPDDSRDSDCDPYTLQTACSDVARGTYDSDVDCGFFRKPICRSAGFWSVRGGDEGRDANNITQAVIDSAGGSLTVCGQVIDSSIPVGGLDSALEALCVKTQGVHQRQLYRQLTAAKLNCALSGADDCDDLVSVYSRCDDACAEGESADRDEVTACADALSCFNEGGRLRDDGKCARGTCSVDGEDCGGDVGECRRIDVDGDRYNDNRCEPLEDSCHDRDLCESPDEALCFDPVGAASSPKSCQDARQNDCTIDGCP
jgi:hypothetical protein